MVKDNTFFNILLKHPYRFSEEEKENLERVSKKYPYFQIAKTMQLKYLKERRLPYNQILAEVAAQTIDRKVLYLYIEDEKLLFRSKETFNTVTKGKINVVEAGEKSSTHQAEKSVEKIVEISQKKDIKADNLESLRELHDKLLIDSPDYDEKSRGVTIVDKRNVIPKRNIDQKMTYLEWLEQLNQPEKEKKSNIFDAVDAFLKNKPKIVPVKNKSYKAPAIIEESVTEKQMLMTETLANLYVKQKKYDKAIQAFKILSLKYPKKSSYFANRISEIKQN